MIRSIHAVLLVVLVMVSGAQAANVVSATASTNPTTEGGSTTVSGYATGAGPTLGVTVNWGDGTANSATTFNPNLSEAWLSYNGVMNLTSTGVNTLTRGQITGSASSVAELEFYHSTVAFGVSLPAATSGMYGTGSYDAGAHPSLAALQNGFWNLPGGQDGSFPTYVGKSAINRGMDTGETGALPGGVAGVADLQFHAAVGSEQTHVIAFVAPGNGIYEVRNFGIRRPINSLQAYRTTVRVFSAQPSLAGDTNYIGATLTANAASQEWVLDNNVYYMTLTAGQKIHFAVQRGDFVTPGSDDWSFDDTELTFDITRVHQYSFNHTYTDDPAGTSANETYARTVTATDAGTPATVNLPATVNNLAPAITSVTVTNSTTAADTVTVSGVFADAAPADTFNVSINWGDGSANNIPVGAGGTTFNLQHSYVDSSGAQAGQAVNFTVQVTITDDDLGIVATTRQASVTFNTPALSFVSGPTATPSGATVNQEVTFNGGVNVSGASVTWDFKDGTAVRTGQVVGHLFAAAGTYIVTATAAHAQSNQTLQRTVTVVVTATSSSGGGGGGTGGGGDTTGNSSTVDTDSDGFGDEIETAMGSNPTSAGSTPFGLAQPTADETLNVLKAQIKLNHGLSGADSITVSGTVVIKAGFVVAGARVLLNCGGVVKSFELDSKGKAGDSTQSFKLTVKAKNGVVLDQQAKFQLKMKNGSYSTQLADEELLNTTAKNAPRKVYMQLVMGSTTYSREVSADYTSTIGRSGRFQ